MRKIFALFLLFFGAFFPLESWEFVNKFNETIQLDLCISTDLPVCEEIFVNAFLLAYQDFSIADLGVEDKTVFLHMAFSDVYDDFQTGLQQLVVARHEGKIIGFAGYKNTEKKNQIYISQLAVDPAYWRRGIGSHLVFTALTLFDNVQSLVVIPRKINAVARNFYYHIGFKESKYMHPGYNPERYTGYEWILGK